MRSISRAARLCIAGAALFGAAQAIAAEDSCAALQARLDGLNQQVAAFDAREQAIERMLASYQRIRSNLLKTPPSLLDERIATYRAAYAKARAAPAAATDGAAQRRLEAIRVSLDLLLQMKQGSAALTPVDPENNPVAGKIRLLDSDLSSVRAQRRQQLGDAPDQAYRDLQRCRGQAQAGGIGLPMEPMTPEETQAMEATVTGRTGPEFQPEKIQLGGSWDTRRTPGDPWRRDVQVIRSQTKGDPWISIDVVDDKTVTIHGISVVGPDRVEGHRGSYDRVLTGTITDGGNTIRWSDGSIWRRSTGAVEGNGLSRP